MMGFEPTASGATIQRSNQTELHPPRQAFQIIPQTAICTQESEFATIEG